MIGWGYLRTKDYGETLPMFCEYCENDVYFHLVKGRYWVYLFYFIPLFPYSSDYWFVCPICEYHYEIQKKPAINQAKELRESYKGFQLGEITEDEYIDNINRMSVEWMGSTLYDSSNDDLSDEIDEFV